MGKDTYNCCGVFRFFCFWKREIKADTSEMSTRLIEMGSPLQRPSMANTSLDSSFKLSPRLPESIKPESYEDQCNRLGLMEHPFPMSREEKQAKALAMRRNPAAGHVFALGKAPHAPERKNFNARVLERLGEPCPGKKFLTDAETAQILDAMEADEMREKLDQAYRAFGLY